MSRFSRNTVDFLGICRRLKRLGVEIRFDKENIWTFDGKGELLITIMSSLAQEESRSISENVTWGMRESMRQGKAWVPYSVFLGYNKGPDGNWVVVPEQAAIVRRIFGMYLQGMSPYHIGRILESEGVEFSKGKTKWHATTITSILKNEKYKGDALRQKTYTSDFLTKEKVKNDGALQQYYIHEHHEAIIRPELFDRVQMEIKNRGTAGQKRGGNRLFSMRVKCGDCGGWYGPCTWAYGTPRERLVWRCNHKYAKGKKNCTPPAVSEKVLKEAFVSAVNKLFADKDRVLDAFEVIKDELFNVDGFLAEKNELENELRLVEGLLQTAGPEQKINLNRRMEVACNRKSELEKIIVEKRLKASEIEYFMKDLAEQEALTGFDEEVWYQLIDYMTVYDRQDVGDI